MSESALTVGVAPALAMEECEEGVPARTVGRRRPSSTLSVEQDTKAHVKAWRKALPTPFVPRGVYRFKSHEEADEWMWMMLTRKTRR